LIDQKISELQHQNDEAAQQRQRQIDIAQSQLDHWVKTGDVWNRVYELMNNGIAKDTQQIISSSELMGLLEKREVFSGLSQLEKMTWLQDLENQVAQAAQWLKVGNSTESLLASKELKSGQSITFKTSDGKTISGKLSGNGDIVADGKTYKNVYRNWDGNYYTDEAY
jgi:hypothetical protein